jgi:hypothetical protein
MYVLSQSEYEEERHVKTKLGVEAEHFLTLCAICQ